MKLLTLTCLGIGILILISGCAGTPSSKFYTLSPITDQAKYLPKKDPLSIAISPIKFPDFLDRAQIVTRPSPNTLKVSEIHRWGGSLSSNFVQIFGENLSALLGTDRIFYPRQIENFSIDYRVRLNVKAFEGELGKEVVLNVDWIVIDQRQKDTAIMQNTIIRESAEGPDYESFVSAQSRALGALSRQIASVIK